MNTFDSEPNLGTCCKMHLEMDNCDVNIEMSWLGKRNSNFMGKITAAERLSLMHLTAVVTFIQAVHLY